MFRKTRFRLVAINTLILFIILNLFGAVVYVFAYSRLFSRVDYSLMAAANHLKQEQYRNLPHLSIIGRPDERRVVFLLWNKQNQLVQQVPQEVFGTGDLGKLRENLSGNNLQTLKLADGHKYRSLAIPVSELAQTDDFDPSVSRGLPDVAVVQLLLNIDAESGMLSDLVLIIVIGGLVGGLVSLFAGLFLADRALIPIKKSWDKQQEFVADASHELRTPLSVVQGQLELLFRHPDHTIEQDSVRISSVLTEVKRMIKMVTELLTLARSDSNQVELERKEFYLDELINHTAEQFEVLADIKQVKLNTYLDKSILFYGDKERLKQLLMILLDNAVKFAPEQGQIKVACHKMKNGIKLTVEDTGVGIPEKDLALVFDRFYRGDKARSRAGGGTGLGLAIAKWIVQAHHGEIWAESKVTEGTKIHIILPTKRIEGKSKYRNTL